MNITSNYPKIRSIDNNFNYLFIFSLISIIDFFIFVFSEEDDIDETCSDGHDHESKSGYFSMSISNFVIYLGAMRPTSYFAENWLIREWFLRFFATN